VERKNGQIHFSEEEQRRFDVRPVVSLESACRTALVFHDVAQTLCDISVATRCEENPRSQHDGVIIKNRADRMKKFALDIAERCPDEIARVRQQALEAYMLQHPEEF
jgi:hypothetical protein